ncbi:hypothetical protein Kim5_PA00052 (plasmid) [Rhizobium sp. Kim5]|nr:hypothetical protein Kim5_PA00052 [Rhizobium sp. Kim5]
MIWSLKWINSLPPTTPPQPRSQDCEGYSLEDLAVASGLTVEEIAAAEGPLQIVPQHHLERIEHVIS